jgi:histidyl-tRNA synthetase
LPARKLGQAGVARLNELVSAVQAAGVNTQRLVIDAVIARGLDYYTGTIYETFLGTLPDLGSICSGGRYDNLAALYTNQQLPGIGASLGLDRLLAGMEELGMLPKITTPAEIFIPYFDPNRLHDYLRLAAQLRMAGFGVEVFPEAKKLGQQLKYADRRGFRVALVAGENEFAAGNIQIKYLATTTSETVPLTPEAAELIAALQRLLATSS